MLFAGLRRTPLQAGSTPGALETVHGLSRKMPRQGYTLDPRSLASAVKPANG